MPDTSYLLNALSLSVAIIISNIGIRYIVLDLDSKMKGSTIGNLLAHPNARFVYIFCMSYIGIRDPVVSAIMGALYVLLI